MNDAPLSPLISEFLAKCPEHLRDRVKRAFETTPSAEEVEAEERARREDSRRAYRMSCVRRSGLSGKQLENTFKSFAAEGLPEEIKLQKNALNAAYRFAVEFPETPKGVAFWGTGDRGYGIGKDHLLHAIANFVLLRKQHIYDVRYRFSYTVARNMRQEWQRHNDEDTREGEILRECDLLLIGDLHDFFSMGELGFKGKEIQAEVFDLINQCESTGRPKLCFTANLSPEEFDKQARRVGSRLAGCCNWYELRGPDRRRT